jgi:hypothetical protein
MTAFAHPFRLFPIALACLAASACSLWEQDPAPVAAGTKAAAAPASTPGARASVPVLAIASAPAGPVSAWGLATYRLDPEAMVGQTWIFPSANPLVYRDNRFVFRRDHVEASNARDHASGAWAVERDKLCVTLGANVSGSACYYVTGTPPAGLRIRALPDGEPLPLRIQ